jgi:hypothetical protein
MTSPPLRATAGTGRWTACAVGAATLLIAGSALAASAADLYYERTLMAAVDTRCRLFEPAIGAARNSAAAQARGAALRSGMAQDGLASVERRARGRAAAADCASADIATAATRVRTAFKGYAQLTRMTWPGDVADWRGDRTVTRLGPMWRLSQTSAFGADRLTFGFGGEGTPGALLAAASFADGKTPYAARLVMRDPARAAQPYLDRRQSGAKGPIPLSNRTPPPQATRAFAAEARSTASERLRPAGAKSAMLFRFPMRAADALAGLDPREAVAVEFLFAGSTGDQVRRSYIEVGDFAAGRAFLQVGPR